jgi:hypothetical protein
MFLKLLKAFRLAESIAAQWFQRTYSNVYLAIQQRLPCNTATFTLQYSNVYLAISNTIYYVA